LPDPIPPQESEDIMRILAVIRENPALTQREISSRLGFSLGKVNYLIRSVIQRGLVKVDNFKTSGNKISYLYKLTPRGIEEKTRTTYLFLKRKMAEYERLEEEIRELRRELEAAEGAAGAGKAREERP